MSTQVIREVAGKQVIRDIRLGMLDRELLDKYKLSSDQEHVLSAIRRILTGEIISDIRSGMSDLDLSQKYRLSYKTLRRIFMKLVDAGVLGQEEVDRRWTVSWYKPDGGKIARLPRNYLPYPVTVYVVGESEAKGLLLDITESGVSVAGIEAQVDETKTFCVIAHDISRIRPFVFEARCRWVRIDADTECIAGYSIERISDHDLLGLRDFIQTLSPIWQEAVSAE